MSKYIAVKGLTNTLGLGIVEFDSTNEHALVEEVDGDKVLHSAVVNLYPIYNDETEDYDMGFYWWGDTEYKLNEFIRVGY